MSLRYDDGIMGSTCIARRARARGSRRTRLASIAMEMSALLPLSIASIAIDPRVAVAHDQAGALGAGASATDYYRVSCFDDGPGAPASLTLSVRDSAPSDAQRISVQVEVAGVVASTTDLDDADALFSPTITLNGGAGVYHVLVDKNAAGAETYQFAYHCWTGPNGTGLHTGTGITAVQSQ